MTQASNYGGVMANTGMLLANEHTSIGSCIDGTSNTIIVAEQSGTVNNGSDGRNRYISGWGHCYFPGKVPNATSGEYFFTGITCVLYGINSSSTTAPPGGADNSYDVSTILNSGHTGGINVVLTDGSVRLRLRRRQLRQFPEGLRSE